jgi:hypothetical protein
MDLRALRTKEWRFRFGGVPSEFHGVKVATFQSWRLRTSSRMLAGWAQVGIQSLTILAKLLFDEAVER